MDRSAEGKTIVAFNAHPDDEMGYASVLTHYARRGASVRLVTLTAGQKGFRAHVDVEDGEALARLRREEIRRVSDILGLEPPKVLEFVDQELLGAVQERVRERVAEVLDELRPDVVITFGPDGVTGHADHRAVSSFVTEILQARSDGTPRLFYYALSPSHVAAVAEHTGRVLLGVSERYLTTRIVVSEEEVETGIRAIGEYRSQFDPDAMRKIQAGFRNATKEVWFRQVFPLPTRSLASGPAATFLFEGTPGERPLQESPPLDRGM